MDRRLEFRESRDCLRIALAQISPAYDQDVFESEFVVRVRDPHGQAERITRIIEHARAIETDLLLFPELVAPFAHLAAIEETLRRTTGDFVACIPYEHTALKDFLPLLSPEQIEQQGLTTQDAETRLVNFSRIFIRAGEDTKVFTQIKLTPFSGEFSLSAKDTLVCGNVLHRFITNWGTFVFLICKDYVGEVRADPPIPMFDFLKSLTDDELHYIFVSALNPEPEAFLHAARSFYYLQEKSSRTYSVFLNGAELDHTTVVFPARPHPRVRGAKDVQLQPLFETKPGWGTQIGFPGVAERLISARFARLDTYTNLPTKEIFSPVYETQVEDLPDLGIESVLTAIAEDAAPVHELEVAPEPVHHNLPPQATPFVGREDELAEVTRLLVDRSCRLVTLVGPGGIGKSRLGLQAASDRTSDFPHGVYLVPLAPVSSVEFIVPTVADSLSFSLVGREEPRVQILNYLREKHLLLLMDSFEHVLEGAGLVGEILQTAPEVKVLATSQERLNITGEWTVSLEGLAVPLSPDVEDICQFSAVRLFVESAQRARAGFALTSSEQPYVVRICQLVSGMPLAIELASSWVRALSCEEILEEMEQSLDLLSTSSRDAPERHRSLRAVFDHSWALLSEQEREALMRLSIFRGGFRREAARAVADASLPVVSALVDKSLLRWDPSGRYQMHQLLRDYVDEKLDQTPGLRAEAGDRHSTYFASFLHERRKHLRGADEQAMEEEIGQEIENVRRAWSWATGHARRDEIDKSLNSLHRFYWIRGLYSEGESALGSAVQTLRAGEEDSVLGKALAGQGAFKRALSRYDEATELLGESLRIFRRLGRKKYAAFSLGGLGMVSVAQGRYEEAQRLYEESLALSEETEDPVELAEALNGLGMIASRQGRYADAEDYYQRALSVCRQTGDRKGIASALNNLGSVASLLDEKEKARELFEEAFAIKKEQGDRVGAATPLSNLGAIAGELGDYQEARRVFEETLAIRRETGNRVGICNALTNLGVVAVKLGAFDEARERLREALLIAAEIQAEPTALTTLPFFADVLRNTGDKEQALEIVALVRRHPASPEGKRKEAERMLDTLKGELSPPEASAAEERGSGGDLWQLVRKLVSGCS
jgi:predicted ATPase